MVPPSPPTSTAPASSSAPQQGGADADMDSARARLQRLQDLYAVAHLFVDFLAGITFTVGSVLFFWPAWETLAIWLFVIGSILFTVKPSVRLAHTLHDTRTRRSLERTLSEEARASLAAFAPRTRALRL